MSPASWFRAVGLCGFAVVLGVLVPAWSDEEKGKKYALLVGVNEYESGKLASLQYAENDVDELAKVLKANSFDVRLLSNSAGKKDKKDAPTAANVRKALETLMTGRRKGETVLIALSGHGLQLEVHDPD